MQLHEKETQLYRHFDKDGNLLYVGISLSAINRLCQHRASSWFRKIETIKIETFGCRQDALDAEYKAITTEQPKYNVIYSKHIQEVSHQEEIMDALEQSPAKKMEMHIIDYFSNRMLLNLKDASECLSVSTGALKKLASENVIGYTKMPYKNGYRLYFSPWNIIDFIEFYEKRI